MITLEAAHAADAADWTRLRHALWPQGSMVEHAADIAETFATPGKTLNIIARNSEGLAVGFAEASLRQDYVNGTKTSPVAFLEGIYVAPAERGTGIARKMVEAVEHWARQQECTELASDAAITNAVSQKMHVALGFEETQRVVFFRKVLSQ